MSTAYTKSFLLAGALLALGVMDAQAEEQQAPAAGEQPQAAPAALGSPFAVPAMPYGYNVGRGMPYGPYAAPGFAGPGAYPPFPAPGTMPGWAGPGATGAPDQSAKAPAAAPSPMAAPYGAPQAPTAPPVPTRESMDEAVNKRLQEVDAYTQRNLPGGPGRREYFKARREARKQAFERQWAAARSQSPGTMSQQPWGMGPGMGPAMGPAMGPGMMPGYGAANPWAPAPTEQ